MNGILVPLSPGELLDKITILRIKSARLRDRGQLDHVARELALLEERWAAAVPQHAPLAAERTALEQVNEQLWDIEERIRAHEAAQRFDQEFIELARSVYLRNDERAAIKRRINLALNSAIVEEKSYTTSR